jgi:hypothetical protein
VVRAAEAEKGAPIEVTQADINAALGFNKDGALLTKEELDKRFDEV